MREDKGSVLQSGVEDISTCLSSARKNLNILRDAIYQDLFVMEETQKFMGTGHLMECCDAMFTTLREMDRIQEELDAEIDARYGRGKGDE